MLSSCSLEEDIERPIPIPNDTVSTGIVVGSLEPAYAKIREEIIRTQPLMTEKSVDNAAASNSRRGDHVNNVTTSRVTLDLRAPGGNSSKDDDDSETDAEGDSLNDGNTMEAFRAAHAPPTKKRVIAEKVLQKLPEHMEPFKDWIRQLGRIGTYFRLGHILFWDRLWIRDSS